MIFDLIMLSWPIIGIIGLWLMHPPKTYSDAFARFLFGGLGGWVIVISLLSIKISTKDFWDKKLPWIKDDKT